MKAVKILFQVFLSICILVAGGIIAVFIPRPGPNTSNQEIVRAVLGILGGSALSAAGVANLYRLYWPVQMETWRETNFPKAFSSWAETSFGHCSLCATVGIWALCWKNGNYPVYFMGLLAIITAIVAWCRRCLVRREIVGR